MRVYLDDERKTPDGWVRAYTATEAIKLLMENNVTAISLDHDLGIDETGYDVLLWIEEKVHTDLDFILPLIYIHTANLSARVKMEQAVKAINKEYVS